MLKFWYKKYTETLHLPRKQMKVHKANSLTGHLDLTFDLFTESGRKVTGVIWSGDTGVLSGYVENSGPSAWNREGRNFAGIPGFNLTHSAPEEPPTRRVLSVPKTTPAPNVVQETRLFGVSPTANKIWRMDPTPKPPLKVPDFQVEVLIENGKVMGIKLA